MKITLAMLIEILQKLQKAKVIGKDVRIETKFSSVQLVKSINNAIKDVTPLLSKEELYQFLLGCEFVVASELNEENTKAKFIEQIKQLFDKYDLTLITAGELELDCHQSIETKDNHIHLIYDYTPTYVMVEIYEDGGDNEIGTYTLNYIDMTIVEVKEAYKILKGFLREC